MKFFFRFSFLLIISFSCTSNQNTDAVLHNTNFKLAEFFSKQVDSLTKSNANLSLTVELNKDTTTTFIKDVDWKKEFDFFLNLDIENPKYKDVFVCDTTRLPDDSFLLKYIAKDSLAKIKLAEIYIVNNDVKTVFAQLNSTNYLYSKSTTLYYETGNYFAINAKDNFLRIGFLNSDLFIKGVIK